MIDDKDLIILGEVVLWQKGCCQYVKRYIKGKHPHLGIIQIGLSGEWETVWETTIVKGMNKFMVETK